MQTRFAKNAIVLGLLTAIGPFAIDMYLPALPEMTADLGASVAATQMSLTIFFVALGLSQVVYGPVSDMIGRKPPVYFGLALFVVGAIGCAFAPTIGWLIAFRFVQGVGACAGMVVTLAIVRDLHTGVEAARLMSLVMLVFSVSPILAPLTGSGLIVAFGWRAVFVAVAVVALLGFALVAFALPETRPPERRIRSGFSEVLAGYRTLLADRRFLGLTFIGGFGMAGFFAFLASSSFVYIEHFGLTPTEYSVAFAVNAIGFIGSAQFASTLGRRFGLGRVVVSAVTAHAAFVFALLALTLAGIDSLPVLVGLLFLSSACFGLVIPSTAVLALDPHGPIAGMASALLGTLRLAAGAVMIGLVSLFFDGTTLPMVGAIAFCAAGALALARLTLSGREPAAAPAE
jgi:DHA1 family bicyclomycin/chloramphenicol resistance-like MFS transporter